MQRLVVLALVLLSVLALPATAEDANPGYITHPVWVAPPPEAMLPSNFAEADYRAFVPLFCRLRGDALSECAAVEVRPAQAFLDAAIGAAGAARMGPRDASGNATEGRSVLIFINFPERPVLSPQPSPPASPSLLGIDWLERPTAAQFDQFYPRKAYASGDDGMAAMDCLIGASGRIICTVVDETPGGYGFGDAAVILSRFFRCPQNTSDGRATVGARVRVTLRFNAP